MQLNKTVMPLVMLGALLPAVSQAQTVLGQIVSVQQQTVAEARNSQQRVDMLSDEIDEMRQEYRMVSRRVESLTTYNDNLEQMTASQQREQDSLREQLAQIDVTNQEIVPLMVRMLDALERFVGLDMPFLEQERYTRVQELRLMMARADVDTSEKYRRLLEAYQIEVEYGRNIEAYPGELLLDGEARNVDFLRIGRLALLYQTLDGRMTGYWDKQRGEWHALDDSYRRTVNQGLRIAKRQSAPELIRVPVVLSGGE